ncbi:MAG: GTP cyclohydrolase I [Actinomycetota bacterium]|nr:GTP cyclohydrolase I [Actinomycetota bacterium]
MDLEQVRLAVAGLLDALGLDMPPEERDLTSKRVADLWVELLSGVGAEPAALLRGGFSEGHRDMVALRDIPFFSMCEHHLLPFFGKASIVYLPGPTGQIAGASNLARVVSLVSKRLQVQERLTAEIAEAVMVGVSAAGVLVVAEGEHLCMTMKDHTDVGSKLLTTSAVGVLRDDPDLRREAMALLQRRETEPGA